MSLQTKTGRRKPVVSPSGFVCIFSFVLFSVYLFQQLVYRSFQLCIFSLQRSRRFMPNTSVGSCNVSQDTLVMVPGTGIPTSLPIF